MITNATDDLPEPDALFQHVKRPQWGLAVFAWMDGDRRAFQFEDGRLRLFKPGWFALMQEVDRPAEEAAELAETLRGKLGVSRSRRSMVDEARRTGKKNWITLDDQLTVFRMRYAQDFEDPVWQVDVRGETAPRPLKRHRKPVLELAQELLSEAAFDEAGDDSEVIVAAIRRVLSRTNLVQEKRDFGPLRKVTPEDGPAIVAALRNLLYHEGSAHDPERFQAWVTSLSVHGEKPTWQLATVLPAMVRPEQHFPVTPSAFKRQAKWMAPRLVHEAVPNGRLYERYGRMILAVQREMAQRAVSGARDLVDIHDFITYTVSPSRTSALLKKKKR